MTNNKRTAFMPPAWADAANGFMEYKRAGALSEQTLKSLWYRLRQFAAWVDTAPEKVSRKQLVTYIASKRSAESKRAVRNLFTSFFAWFKADGGRDDDPADMLPRIRKPLPHPTPCTDDMVVAALAKASPAERLMILLAAECGLRRGEICVVHSDDVVTGTHGEHSLIVHGKGDKQRTVPLPDDLAATILAAHGYAFPGRWNGHVEGSYVSKHVSRLLPSGYSCHKLRHRFATVAYSDSHDMLAVARALGHSSPDTTQAYVALPDDSLRMLVDAAAIGSPDTWHSPRDTTPAPCARSSAGAAEPETLRAAAMLAANLCIVALDVEHDGFKFNFTAWSNALAECHPAPIEPPSKTAVAAAFRLMQRDGLIYLAMSDGIVWCGVFEADAGRMAAAGESYLQGYMDSTD